MSDDLLFDREHKPQTGTFQHHWSHDPEKLRRAVWRREISMSGRSDRPDRFLRRFSWEDPAKTVRGTAEEYFVHENNDTAPE